MKLKSQAFTLVEVLVAIAILASLAILVSSTWSGNARRHIKSKINVQAAQLLQLKITELEAEYSQRIASLPLEQVQTGEFEEETYEHFSWEWEAKNLELPDLSALLETDGEDTVLITVLSQFRDYLVASVKEVKVTVRYQRGKQEPLNYTVATYFVDYEQNFNVGIGGGSGLPGGNSNDGGGSNSGNNQNNTNTTTGGQR